MHIAPAMEEGAYFWVRVPVFEVGCILSTHNVKVDLHSLLDVVTTWNSDSLNRIEWEKLAANNFSLPHDVADVLWDLFNTVSVERCRPSLEKSVPLRPFLLFLYLQLYYQSVHLSPQQSQPEAWPERTGGRNNGQPHSPSNIPFLSPTRSVALQAKASQQEAAFLTFVKRHMFDFLILLSGGNPTISAVQLDEISFIIGGGRSKSSPSERISSIIPFREGDSTFSAKEISRFICSSLDTNDILYPPLVSVLGTTTRPLLVEGQLSAGPLFHSQEHNDAQVREISPLCLFQLSKKTVFRRSDSVRGKDVYIFCCQQSFIYVPQSVEYVNVFGCKNCTIFVGPCARALHVEHCEDLQVMSCTRGMRISNCHGCTFSLCVNTSPILSGGNSGITFGPFNTYYGALEDDMEESNVNPLINKWNTPVPFGEPSEHIWSLLTPEKYSPFCIPFAIDGSTISNPCDIPEEYAKAVQNSVDKISKIATDLRTVCGESSVDAQEVQNVLQTAFREWLIMSGNAKQVHGILHADMQ